MTQRASLVQTGTLPDTIDGVIARLDAILDRSLREGDRIGYFAALYERVTTNVRRALVAGGFFEDGPRMERLDVVFANRFLDAWDRHSRGETPSRSWAVAFGALRDPAPLVVQHLLLGMNAHINLDLGVAAATVAPTPAELAALRGDFLRINQLLARLVGVVEDELAEISPRLGEIEHFAPTLENRVFDFGMDLARDGAWALAAELVAAPPPLRAAIVAERDARVAAIAAELYPLRGLAGRVERWVHERESTDVRYNIQVVAG